MKLISCCLFILGFTSIKTFAQSSDWLTVDHFKLSGQVSLKTYKTYLTAIQKDSTAAFYKSQLPDSTIGSASKMKVYLSEKKYESLSAVGISWESAMNYGYWLTKKEQPDTIRYYYRLPTLAEWKKAFQEDSNYFNSGFEDWTLNSYDESFPQQFSSFYYHKKSDYPVLKRKCVVGTSILRTVSPDQPLYYYADHGYKNVGFRLVKIELTPENQRDYNRLIQYLNQ